MVFKRRLKTVSNIDLVPMIDVVFQLVVFFMVSSTFIETPGIRIQYPESQTTEAVRMTSLIVTMVDRDRIYVNKDVYDFDGFSKKINSIDDETRDKINAVVIEGGYDIPYDLLIDVMDVLRFKGFRGINLRLTPVDKKD
ncbi:MAG: biopolymer transporter ExbD [Spirochaetales bacterium]|nr:biopolymer transporter ExbD [Spirochaetales bacterium]